MPPDPCPESILMKAAGQAYLLESLSDGDKG